MWWSRALERRQLGLGCGGRSRAGLSGPHVVVREGKIQGPHVAVREKELQGPHVAVRERKLQGPHMAVRERAPGSRPHMDVREGGRWYL